MENSSIKPIETIYNGYKFRSRLEARWAVFFDALGIKYKYENEGYVLSSGDTYLPDFTLCDDNLFVEIKGQGISDKYKAMLKTFAIESKKALLLVEGLPNEAASKLYCYNFAKRDSFWHSVGLLPNPLLNGTFVFLRKESPAEKLITIDLNHQFDSIRGVYSESGYDYYSNMNKNNDFEDIREIVDYMYHKALAASIKAKQARFEHGEKG